MEDVIRRSAGDLPRAPPHHDTGHAAGTVLCLYTDGLVERRDRPLDGGLAKLSAAANPLVNRW
jgi:hypothetical protein